MKSRQLIISILLVWCQSRSTILCTPIGFDPTSAPLIAMPSMPLPAPMLMASHYDPYGSMQTAASGQYMLASPFMPMPFDTNRRAVFGPFKPTSEKGKSSSKEPSDEQKAMGDLPVSFLDQDEPSSISERISESFSAIGEGVRNHFRSLNENFSDTLEDLKDAWRSDNSKRG